MKFIYSTHATRRMRERNISGSIVKSVLEKPDHRFLDTNSGYFVYLKRLTFLGKERWMAVAVDEKDKTIVSIHPIRDDDFENWVKSGRWK